MASIVRRQGEDFNSSLNCCEIDLKLLWRPLAASLQSYLKTPRTMQTYRDLHKYICPLACIDFQFFGHTGKHVTKSKILERYFLKF